MHRRIGSEASVPYEVHLGWMPHFEFEAFFEPDCAAHAARTASQMPVKPDMITTTSILHTMLLAGSLISPTNTNSGAS